MIIIDANILIYAYNRAVPQHLVSRSWLQSAFDADEPIGLPLNVIIAFLRLTSSGRAMPSPVAIGQGVATVESWLDLPHVSLLNAGPKHWAILRAVLGETHAHGDLVMDAHLAALAIEHSATICTADRDFSRFKTIRVTNPLIP